MRADDLPRLFDPSNREAGRDWLTRQEHGGLYVVVAEIGRAAVARRCLDFLAEADVGPGIVYCFAASVVPHWQSRGIGALMDRHSEALARARGFHALQADVSKTNPRAYAWHERLGYRRVGERIVRWDESDGAHESDCWTVERRWAGG